LEVGDVSVEGEGHLEGLPNASRLDDELSDGVDYGVCREEAAYGVEVKPKQGVSREERSCAWIQGDHVVQDSVVKELK